MTIENNDQNTTEENTIGENTAEQIDTDQTDTEQLDTDIENETEEVDSEEFDVDSDDLDSDDVDVDEDESDEVQVAAPVAKAPVSTTTFAALGVNAEINNMLVKSKITIPSPIQERAIPVALKGTDVVGIAQTGTGKTLAFAIPMLQQLLETKTKGLVLVPTRELALQVAETFDMISASMDAQIRTAVLIGGASMSQQIQKLARKPRIIVATPGRLVDHLERRTVVLNDVSVIVLDEADRMFDMGFAPQIKRVLEVTPKTRQTMLFSATMPPEIQQIADKHLNKPTRIEVTPPGQSVKLITQQVCYVTQDSKFDTLIKFLEGESGLTLVFAKTKHGVKNLTKKIRNAGHHTEEIHSNRSMFQRKKALEGFKSGKYAVLVATDVAARGIDVDDVRLVVNYDLPQSPEDYVHRIGRTGRAGRTGTSVSFATHGESYKVRLIERLTKVEMGQAEHSMAKPAGRPAGSREESYSRQNKRPQRSGGGSNYRGRSDDSRGSRPSFGSRSDSRPSEGRFSSDSHGSESRGGESRGGDSRSSESRNDSRSAEGSSESRSFGSQESRQPRERREYSGARGSPSNHAGRSDSRGSYGSGSRGSSFSRPSNFRDDSRGGNREDRPQQRERSNDAPAGEGAPQRSSFGGGSFGSQRPQRSGGNRSSYAGGRSNADRNSGGRSYSDRAPSDRSSSERGSSDRGGYAGRSNNRSEDSRGPRTYQPRTERPSAEGQRSESPRAEGSNFRSDSPRPESRGSFRPRTGGGGNRFGGGGRSGGSGRSGGAGRSGGGFRGKPQRSSSPRPENRG